MCVISWDLSGISNTGTEVLSEEIFRSREQDDSGEIV